MKGEGKLFSFDLLDAAGGEIRVTAFNAEVDKFFPMIEVGGVILLSKAALNHKKPVGWWGQSGDGGVDFGGVGATKAALNHKKPVWTECGWGRAGGKL